MGPELDQDKLREALNTQGLALEVDAFFACRDHSWSPTHGSVYSEESKLREIDVRAHKQIAFGHADPQHKRAGDIVVLIECKSSSGWWVFTDLTGEPARPSDFLLPPASGGYGGSVAANAVETMRRLVRTVPRSQSVREFKLDYKRKGGNDRQEFYAASQQALSAMRGEKAHRHSAFSLQSQMLSLFVPVVMTDRRPILAQQSVSGDEFTLRQVDWLITGTPISGLVHVVTLEGLESLLSFLDELVGHMSSLDVHYLIQKTFGL